MSDFLIYAFLFFVGSLLGWVLELFFRHWFSSANPEHRWINPGFCVGPYVPLYGFGLCILYTMATLLEDVEWSTATEVLAALALIAVLMTLLEYIAGIFLLKVANVRLWDYSMLWGNINGLICPLFTFFWTVLGVFYYFVIHPRILDALGWLSANLAFSFVIGFFYGVFMLDVAYSIQLVARVKKYADENQLEIKYEEFKRHVYNKRLERDIKRRFFFSLPQKDKMREGLDSFRNSQRALREQAKKLTQ